MNKSIPLLLSLIAVNGGEFYNDPFNEYSMDMDVINCQLEIYFKLIVLLDEYSEDEILSSIDYLNIDSYRQLTEEKQKYIKKDAENILALRRERKNYE
jgi:hypothetical protein